MISVIIPVYNAERYLRNSVESVLNQTYSNWELYLVDDGSSDLSGKMCDDYAKKDVRIHVIHQENSGAGAARNAGIEKVTGRYIVFIDADDYIETNYFELLSVHEEDVVFIDVQLVDEDKRVIRREPMSIYSSLTKDELIRRQMTGVISWGGVYKVVRSKLIKENKIRYTKHKIGEEALLSFLIMTHAASWGFIGQTVYSYVNHDDSLSHSTLDDHWGPVALSLRDYIKTTGQYEEYANTLNAFIQTAAAVCADKVVRNHKAKESFSLLTETRQRMISQTDNAYAVDVKHMSGKARLISTCLEYRLYVLIWMLSKANQRLRR